MKILLTGKNGQVGFELQRSLAVLGDVIAVDHADCDLADPAAIRRLVRDVKPRLIVNPAAYTAVDKAESEVELATAINAHAPGLLGEEARRLGALLVHYSTDYVFDGSGYAWHREIDAPNPQSVYGRTKLQGEQALQASGADHLVFRTSWVFGAHGGNFAKTMLRLAAEREQLKVVADQYGAPTSAALLADVTAQIVSQWQRNPDCFPLGLFHLVAGGVTNWHAYAQAVIAAAQAAGKPLKLRAEDIEAISTDEYPTPARRPLNSRLDTALLRETFGLNLPDWRQGLDHVMQQIL